MTPERAETIALWGAGYVLGDDTLRDRLLGITGLDPGDIRNNLTDTGFLAGILEFLLAHEPDLLAFCERHEIDPHEPAVARSTLVGADPEW